MAGTGRILVQAGFSEFNRWKPPNAPVRKSTGFSTDDKKSFTTSNNNAPLKTLGSSPPGLGSFRPPNLGFGRGSARAPEKKRTDREIEAMLELVRTGKWQERARNIRELQQMGYTAERLYDEALTAPGLQTSMVVACQVYDSIASQEEVPQELLDALNSESQIDSLYHLRILSQKQRKQAAEFLIEKSLDTKGAEELARAIKQHERRAEIREGFSHIPGDCLALLHYRAALESSVVEEKKASALHALEFAVSEHAIAKIKSLLGKLE